VRSQHEQPITIREDKDVRDARIRMGLTNATNFYGTCARQQLGLPERSEYVANLRLKSQCHSLRNSK